MRNELPIILLGDSYTQERGNHYLIRKHVLYCSAYFVKQRRCIAIVGKFVYVVSENV